MNSIMINVYLLVLILFIVLLLGYWARGYIAKRWPSEQNEWHTEVEEFGEEVTARLKREYDAIKNRVRRELQSRKAEDA